MECTREAVSKSPFCNPSLRSSDQQTLLKILECPVCGLVAKPPIFTCEGVKHIICGECQTHATQCPVCETAISTSKCSYVEECIDEVQLQCKYQSEGCQLTLKATGYRFHLATCPFRELDCFLPDCGKTLPFREFFNHLKSAHGNIVNGVENSSVHAVEFWIEGLTPADPARWPPYYFTCFNNVFLYTAMSTRHGMWEWGAILADDEEASRFQITCRLASLDQKSEIIWRGPVHSIRQSPADINRSGLCFVTNSKEMRNPYMYQKRNNPRHFWLTFLEIRQLKPPNPGSIPYLITTEANIPESSRGSEIKGMWSSPSANALVANYSSFSPLKNFPSTTTAGSSTSVDRKSSHSIKRRNSTPRPTLSYIEDPSNPVKFDTEPGNLPAEVHAKLSLLEESRNSTPKLIANSEATQNLGAAGPTAVNFDDQPNLENPKHTPPPIELALPGRSSLNINTPSAISIHPEGPPPVTGSDTFDSEHRFKPVPITAEEWNSRRNSPPITTEIDQALNPPATGIEIYDPNRRVSLFETDPDDWNLKVSAGATTSGNFNPYKPKPTVDWDRRDSSESAESSSFNTNQPKPKNLNRPDSAGSTISTIFNTNQPNPDDWNRRDSEESTASADFNPNQPTPTNSNYPGRNPVVSNYPPFVVVPVQAGMPVNNIDARAIQEAKNNQISQVFANGIQQNIQPGDPVAKITHIRSTQTVAIRISTQEAPGNISATSEPYGLIMPTGGKRNATSDAIIMTAVSQPGLPTIDSRGNTIGGRGRGVQNGFVPAPGNLNYPENSTLKPIPTNPNYPGNPSPMPIITSQGALNPNTRQSFSSTITTSSMTIPQPRRDPTSFKVGELEDDRYIRSDNTK